MSAGGRDPWKMLKNLWSKTKICCWNTCKKRRRKSSRDEEDVDMSDLTSEGTGAMTEAVGEDLGTLEDMVSNQFIFNVLLLESENSFINISFRT